MQATAWPAGGWIRRTLPEVSLPTASLQARARDAAKPGCGDLNVGAASRTRNGSFFLGAGEVGTGR